jgi:hypothetical protein
MFCHEGFRRSAISHPRASKFGDYQSTLGAKNQTSYMTDSGWEKIEQIREVNLSDVQTQKTTSVRYRNGAETREGNLTPLACSPS